MLLFCACVSFDCPFMLPDNWQSSCQNKCYSWCTVATALGTHSIRPYSCKSRDFDMALMRPSFIYISARECLVSVSALFPLDFSSVDASGEVFNFSFLFFSSIYTRSCFLALRSKTNLILRLFLLSLLSLLSWRRADVTDLASFFSKAP